MVGAARDASHSLAKLTPEQVQNIRDRFDRGGVTKAQLGREFGLSATGVWRVITGRSYTEEKTS
jgi:antitoxin component HigA of HigAB toxin-antitoxin module